MAYTHVMESPMPHEEKDIHTKVLYRAKSELPLDHPISTFDELLNKQNFKYRLRFFSQIEAYMRRNCKKAILEEYVALYMQGIYFGIHLDDEKIPPREFESLLLP